MVELANNLAHLQVKHSFTKLPRDKLFSFSNQIQMKMILVKHFCLLNMLLYCILDYGSKMGCEFWVDIKYFKYAQTLSELRNII